MRPRDFVKRYAIRSLVCCFSGGKDSLVATHYTLSDLAGIDIGKYVLFVNTTVSCPGVQEYVKEICEAQGWPIVIVAPKVPFFELAEKWGMPLMRRRWCCFYLKLQPIIEFTKTLRKPRCEVTGLRRVESRRRKDLPEYFFHKKGEVWKYAPLIDWSDNQVAKYIKEHGLKVNPLYRLIRRSGECICGAFTSKRELKIIRGNFPEFFQQFVDLEKRFRKGGSAFWKSGKPLRAEDLMKQKTLFEEEK